MFPYSHPYLHHAAVPVLPSASSLRSSDVTLVLRQQPRDALMTAPGKEKARKPVDPPPIIQLSVKPSSDPTQNFLQSPYVFMCGILYKEEKDEPVDGGTNRSLAGSLVSSLHRLKDIDNKDGGFFVFGDISVKILGTFRLHFSLFDLQKDNNEVQFLGSITTKPFNVQVLKDFRGMDESTYLSRAFSDQGVRLRLRKEPRAVLGNKRSYPYGADTPASSSHIRTNPGTIPAEYSYGDSSPNKRRRPDDDDYKREHYLDYSAQAFSAPAYSAPTHSTTTHSAPTYSAPTHSTATRSAPTHSVPTHSAPTRSASTHSTATHSIATHSAAAYSPVTYPAATYSTATHSAATYPATTYPATTYPTATYPATAYSTPTQSTASYSTQTYPAQAYSGQSYPTNYTPTQFNNNNYMPGFL